MRRGTAGAYKGPIESDGSKPEHSGNEIAPGTADPARDSHSEKDPAFRLQESGRQPPFGQGVASSVIGPMVPTVAFPTLVRRFLGSPRQMRYRCHLMWRWTPNRSHQTQRRRANLRSSEPVPRMGTLYRELWRFSGSCRRQLVWAGALLLGSQIFRLAVPALSGAAINAVQIDGVAGLGRAGVFLLCVFAATLASWSLHGPGRILERNVALTVRQQLSTDLMQRLFNAPLAWHETGHGIETAHRVQQSTRALYDFAQSQYIYLQSATSLIGPVIALWLISAWVGAAAVTGYMLLGAIIVCFDQVLMRLAAIENEADRRYWSSLSDGFTNILSIFALRMRRSVLALIGRRLAAVFEPVRKTIVYNEAKWASVDLLNCALWIMLVSIYVGLSVSEGTGASTAGGSGIALGSLFMVYQYAQQAGGVIVNIAVHFQTLSRQRSDFGSAAPIRELPLGAGPQADPLPARERGEGEAPSADMMAARVGAGSPPSGLVLKSIATSPAPGAPVRADFRALHFQGVEFFHHRTGDEATQIRAATLSDVSLRLHRGRHYALIGPSGSGKTTLLRLLAGLYEATDGTISIDGDAPSDAGRLAAWLQTVVTLMPQDSELFGGTVRENLLLAMDPPRAQQAAAGHRKIDSALAVAQAADFVQRMRGGIESPVATRGGNLSGGQRQRLAIARAVLAAVDSSILLLDEPTSALDPETEDVLIEALLAHRRDATVIASIHRPRLIKHFDEVIVVNAGRIVNQGTVEELQTRCIELQTFLGRGRRSTD